MRSLNVLAFCLFVLPFTTTAQSASSESALPFTLKSLGHGIYAAIDDAKGDAGANAGFVIGDDGVLVIDTFEKTEAARALLTEIRKLTKLPVKFVVNTHYHLDHVAGNKVFQNAGAVVIAQRNVYSWIHTENLKFFGKAIKPEERSMVESLSVPDVLYDNDLDVVLGKREIVIHSFPGHTGGDSVVMIPDAKVYFCGDLFWRKTLPNLIDATTSEWSNTLDDLIPPSPSPETIYVPGHGDVGNAQDVEAFHTYLNDLRGMVGRGIKAGKEGDDLVKEIMPALTEKYSTWEFFKYFAKPNILDMAAEINGKKRVPSASAPEKTN